MVNGISTKFPVLFALIAITVGFGPVRADIDMRGELGLDIRQDGYTAETNATGESESITRTLSNHFLNLNMGGPVINNNLANFSARANIWGTYYLATTDTDEKNEFTRPDLRMYYGQLTLFPSRPYPLKLYRTKTYDFSLNYEQGNRSKIDVVQTELAVIRRYRGDRTATGSQFRMNLAKNLDLLSEYRQEKTASIRKYDFNEDRDISILFAETGNKHINEIDTITIANDLPDADILVLIDNVFDTTLAVGEEIEIYVDSGKHEVDITPLTYYNPYRFTIDLRAKMVWKIYYQEPSTPKDIEQTSTVASVNLRYDDEGKFINETFYEYNDLNEANQKMTSYLGNFSNRAGYKLSREMELSFLTTYNRNRTSVDTTSFQLSKMLTHTSTISYARRKGAVLSLSHAYNRNMSRTGFGSDLKSTLNTFTNRVMLPFKTLKYKLDMRNTVSFLGDNQNYINNQYSTEINNGIEQIIWGLRLQPQNMIKFTVNHQENPAQDSKEFEYKFRVLGDIFEHRIFGSVNFNVEYGYRKKFDDIGSDIKKRYLFDMSLIKRFGKKIRTLLLSTKELETFGGSTPTAGANPSQADAALADVTKSSYKIDVQVMPANGMMLGGNYMVITQETTTIQKMGATISVVLPLLRLPVQSYLLSERRDLPDLPRQSQISMETKLNYQFRQISLTLTHSYIREKLIIRTFAFHEINARLSRQFGVF